MTHSNISATISAKSDRTLHVADLQSQKPKLVAWKKTDIATKKINKSNKGRLPVYVLLKVKFSVFL